MTIEQAQRAFHLERSRAIGDLRKPFEEAVKRVERGVLVPVIKRPGGPFRRFLMRDYERIRRDSQERCAAVESARAKLDEFDARAKDRQSGLQRDINERTQQRCDAFDPAILDALRREQSRKDEAKRLAEAVSEFNRATGEKHEIMLPEVLKRKCGGTLVDAIELTGQLFARVTSDKGYSYELFPWESGMEAYIGRLCWYWYDGNGRVRFEPQAGIRAPLPRSP